MNFEWRSQDAYHEEHQLVDADDKRIIGVVSGSKYQSFAGWQGRVEGEDFTKRLGRFTDLKAAKSAVENWWNETFEVGGKG
jgi:hypothetical protein